MTTADTASLLNVAAEAALAIPGVAGLQPRFANRLAAATAPTRPGTTPPHMPPEAGIRADRAQDGSGWHIEVRCVLTESHPALDIAGHVHDRVRTAVSSHLATQGAAEPVTATVTVTRIVARHDTA
ncbi:hypothetical protein [Streptomyces goshikiensis]|uniref:hypothetical protein n=1 Tax=Streptomyces goshikiensis TaxID=1942 RepID=UPI0036ADC173